MEKLKNNKNVLKNFAFVVHTVNFVLTVPVLLPVRSASGSSFLYDFSFSQFESNLTLNH